MLYSEQMQKILDKYGVDTSNLPDNLYSTLLDAIYNADVSAGGGTDTPETKGITLSDGTVLPMIPTKDGYSKVYIIKRSSYYYAYYSAHGWGVNSNSNYIVTIDGDGLLASDDKFVSTLPVDFTEFNTWSEPTATRDMLKTSDGTVVAANCIINKWTSQSNMTSTIYFNQNF